MNLTRSPFFFILSGLGLSDVRAANQLQAIRLDKIPYWRILQEAQMAAAVDIKDLS